MPQSTPETNARQVNQQQGIGRHYFDILKNWQPVSLVAGLCEYVSSSATYPLNVGRIELQLIRIHNSEYWECRTLRCRGQVLKSSGPRFLA